MRRRIGAAILAAVGMGVAYSAWAGGESGVKDKHPVYVGVRVCTQCHDGQAAGHQFSLWRVSKHAQAYAALATPEAKRIATLSGLPEEPQKSSICLGCHATATEAEPWEKEPTFAVEDGVQCEKCHGPGSEYIDEDVMRDRSKALAAGLKMPGEKDCRVCHVVKGSHVAVLKTPVFDFPARLAQIAHPTSQGERNRPLKTQEHAPAGPERATPAPANPSSAGTGDGSGRFLYTGARACGTCHQEPARGYQYSKWRRGPHARAYAVLGTPAGAQMAVAEGLKDNPQTSPQCLRCHTTGAGEKPDRFLPEFDPAEGVQCESCHGPGSEYSPEAVMYDKRAARQAGLRSVTRETCLPCHEKAHGRNFDYDSALKAIAHPRKPAGQDSAPQYKTPLNLGLSPDGRELYVACEAGNVVVVVDAAARKVLTEIPVGSQPTDVTFSPDGKRAYASNRFDDTVSVIDTATRRVVGTVPVGDEPHGVLLDAAGRFLYVLNTSEGSVSVVDATTLKEDRRLMASQGPWSLALSPNQRTIAATNTRSRFVPFRAPSVSEVTLIDTETGAVVNRATLPGANMLQGVAWHPRGEFALVTLMRTKNLVPMTRLLQGWTITNGLGVIWHDGRVDQVLLDEPGVCFPDPSDVAFSPDGKYAFVTSSGSDCVAVIDAAKLVSMLKEATPYEREHVFPNHLGKPTEFVVKHIPTQTSPRGVVCTPDGRTAFVANALDDSLTVIDVARLVAVERIDLGGPKEITEVRRGERLFHSAKIAFHREFACHSCHPDGHINGLTFDIEPDGIGLLPVDNRTLRGVLDTAPFKWEGTNPTLERECGPRLAVFFTRIQPFTPDELAAVAAYISTIPRPPNRYRPVGGELTAAQRRGKAIFERTLTNDRREIPLNGRCATCHPAPYFTDRTRRNIGTKMAFDNESDFDVPHLNNIYDSAPYLHNGSAPTLEEIWTRYNLRDQHGVTNDMTKDQLNDLIEYLKTL